MDNSRISLSFPSRLLAGMGLVILLMQPVQAAGWDIDQLMQSMAKIRSGQANFLESKNIAMLNAPIVSEGELFYTAPDRLEKRTIKPKPESMVLQ
ncbi:MAG: outer membrane lipoprotein carrier protein LolA, partial [Nitrosomonadales bacterium]|nr:outer membrane lipoprotein carrier protein LolA [Nitrosomonadales bacterium]